MRQQRKQRSAPPTRTQWIDDTIRAAIINGELAPGSRLVLSDLAERHDVSVTPLREALARLAVDGLVELRPHGSALVAPVSIDDAEEVYEIRRLLEPRALATSIAAADASDHELWQTTYDKLGSGRSRVDGLHRHAAYHRALLSACPSSWMLRTLGPLHDHSLRFVAAVAGLGERKHNQGEHGALLELALAGRADEAAALLDQHLVATIQTLRAASAAHEQRETELEARAQATS